VDRLRRLPANLRGGLALILLLLLLALSAPLVATSAPWLVRDASGLRSPALLEFFGAQPRLEETAGTEVLLRAPIPYGPEKLDLWATLRPPSAQHWMGTDAIGRDIASRVLHGARVSLMVGLLAAGFALLVGVPLGALAGYRGGIADAVISRMIEGVLCFPTLLLILAILASSPAWLFSLPDGLRIALVLGLTGWITVARYLRAEFIKLNSSEMVSAARALGGSDLRIMLRHILPCSLAPVLVTAAFAVGAAIGLEAALSFLGLGVRPPTPSWGGLLSDAMEFVSRGWWLALFPGVALFLAILSCNLIGEGVRDLLDPNRSRR
jgi:peptide/nickel transport system permease protein